jgi:predicted dehydrogenase
MSQIPFKTAILGLNEQGKVLAECAAKSELFKIEAVADKDADLAQRTAAEYGCRHYDDYRLAVMQTGLDVIFAAAPLYACAEYIHAALGKKLHVLRIAPAARTFEELAGFVHHAAESEVSFSVVSVLRLNKVFTALHEYLKEEANNIPLVIAQCGFGQFQEPWRRDPKLAGGGILLYDCYEIMDQIVLCFGTPDEVYAVHTSQAPDRRQRLSVAEDTAVVTMKFGDTLTVNLVAGNILKPQAYTLNIYSKGKNIFVQDGQLSIFDNQNKLLEKSRETASNQKLVSKFAANFAQSIVDPAQTPPISTGADHLETMALIESAYLSSRTGSPESPRKILQMSQNVASKYLFK